MSILINLFKNDIIDASLNETYICIIPIVGIISCAYKISAQVPPSTVYESQWDFTAVRQVLDASLIENELIDEWISKKKEMAYYQTRS